MRIASVSKAFSGATALALVSEGVLGLDDTIGDWLPDLPDDWHSVTLRQLLQHTSGVPDYTEPPAFGIAVEASPTVAPPPRELLDFADEDLDFPPGSQYQYSNSDNIVVGLMVEAATGVSYEQALAAKVTGPQSLSRTLMAAGILIPRPFIHGYGGTGEDVSQEIAFGGWAWASGGILATPADFNDFARAYVGGRLFNRDTIAQQRQFVPGASEPAGPGTNAAGLALFRYRTGCGSMLGHTGSIFGYTQLIASSRNGRRSIALTINTQVSPQLLPELRRAQVRAVCAALADR